MLIATISNYLAKPIILLSVIKTVDNLFGGARKTKFTPENNFLLPPKIKFITNTYSNVPNKRACKFICDKVFS